MAAAQILHLTHTVDNKVTDVGRKLKEVDDKMDVVMKGRLCWPLIDLSQLSVCWLDGKDKNEVLQRTSNNVDDLKCPPSALLLVPLQCF
jgi:hypothetical protein